MKDLIKYERPGVPAVIPKMIFIREVGFVRFKKRGFFRNIIFNIKLGLLKRKLRKLGVKF